MGLLDSMVGMLGGNSPDGPATGALVQQITQILAANAQGGGLGGLVQSFERMGLGHIVNSWIGTGQNLPISPEQLQQVLGQGRIGQIAQSLGLQPDQVATQLSQLLPHVVDQVTPQGQVPAAAIAHTDIAGALSAILGQAGGAAGGSS
jgi:uncharacterized protein YidB (DUF937 family)